MGSLSAASHGVSTCASARGGAEDSCLCDSLATTIWLLELAVMTFPLVGAAGWVESLVEPGVSVFCACRILAPSDKIASARPIMMTWTYLCYTSELQPLTSITLCQSILDLLSVPWIRRFHPVIAFCRNGYIRIHGAKRIFSL
jgi:hypothetical protein